MSLSLSEFEKSFGSFAFIIYLTIADAQIALYACGGSLVSLLVENGA